MNEYNEERPHDSLGDLTTLGLRLHGVHAAQAEFVLGAVLVVGETRCEGIAQRIARVCHARCQSFCQVGEHCSGEGVVDTVFQFARIRYQVE